MSSKVFLLIFASFLSFNIVAGQNERLYCNYHYYYICDLEIYNPRGLNNFYAINGSFLNTHTTVRKYSPTPYWNSSIIPSILCNTFVNLQRMELDGLGVKNILIFEIENPLENCKNLTYLDLCNNKLTGSEEMPFSFNTNLQELRLCDNELSSLSSNFFTNLTNLTILRLSDNRLADLPENLFGPLESLEELYLDNNNLSFLNPEWFETLTNLRTLQLYSNMITDIPASMFTQLLNLTNLFLQYNKISSLLPGTFSDLKNLNTLHLYNNSLEVIYSSSFGTLPNLKNVRFDSNQIDAIDRNFILKTGIISLNMAGNICAPENIFDNSTGRYSMQIMLSTCFENFDRLAAESTTIPATNSSTTTSNNSPTSTSHQVTTTNQETTTKDPITPPKCSDENIDERVCDIEDGFEDLINQNKIFAAEIEALKYKMNELLNRPCACI